MVARLLAKALGAAAAGLQHHHLYLLPAAVACVVIAFTALFRPGIRSRGLLFGSRSRPDEGELFRQIGAAGAATTGSASTYPLSHFIVLCVGMGAVLHVEPLVAAAEARLHPAVVVCAVMSFAVLVNWAVLSLSFAPVALSPNSPTARDGGRKESHPAAAPPPRAAPAVRSHQPLLARAAFVVLASLMSISPFLELFTVAAAELRLPWPAVVATLAVFASCFYASLLIFLSSFLPRPLPAAAPQWDGVACIAAVGVGVLACLVAAAAAAGFAHGYTSARRLGSE